MKRVRGEDDDGDRALSRPQKRERIDVFGRLHDEVWSVPGGNPKLDRKAIDSWSSAAEEQWGGGCSDEYWEAEAEAEAGAEAYPYSYCVQCGADGDPKVVTRWWNTDVMVGIVREGPYIELVFCYGELPDAIRSRGTCILDGREGRLCGACMDTLCSLTRSPVAPEVLRAVGIGADVLPAPVLELVLLYACPELSLHPPAAPPPKRA